jgi:hypothetical protein
MRVARRAFLLGGHSAAPVAEALRARGMPFQIEELVHAAARALGALSPMP